MATAYRELRESDVERYLCRRAKEEGGEVRKVKWIGRNGAPDRLLLRNAKQDVWVELKAPGMKPKAHQLREHDRMRRYGLMVVVVDSFDGVDRLL